MQLWLNSSHWISNTIGRETSTYLIALRACKRLSVRPKRCKIPNCGLLDEKDLAELEPHLAPDVAGGLYFPDDATVQPILATWAFVQAAKQLGATIQTFTEVTDIELSNGTIAAVNTSAGRIPTRIVVNAAGAWSGAIGKMVACCLRFLPALKDIHAIRTYAGLRPYTPDLLLIISEADTVKGFYVATGHEGEGITMGPITGKLISQMITGQELDLPVEELALSRFAQNTA